MSIRPGMEPLIRHLRALTAVDVDSATVAGIAQWSDQHLQDELDRTQQTWLGVRLTPLTSLLDGSPITTSYAVPTTIPGWLENPGTNSGWAVKNVGGSALGTALYSLNLSSRLLDFGSIDQRGAAYYLDCRSYDLHHAAAAIWRQKAAALAQNVDWSSDNHDISAAQEYDHALQLVEHYEQLSAPVASRFIRYDEETRGGW